jgi:TRAP-type C4-dicarboxylate transport system permease large subunit
VRQGIVYYQEAFWGLVGLTILLVLFIILINRNVKAICRILGSVFATYGIIEAAGLLISRGLIHSQLLSLSDMPQSIQPWLLQFSNSFLNPLLIFSISCAALGITLFVVSFLYHRKQKPSIAS